MTLEIKNRRLRWLGYALRLSSDKKTKVATRVTSTRKRNRGRPKNTRLRTIRDERAAGLRQGWVAKFDCGLMSQPGWREWVSAFEYGQERMTCSWAFGSRSAYVRQTFKGDLHGWYSREKRLNFASVWLNHLVQPKRSLDGLFLINPNWGLSSDYEKYCIHLGPKVTYMWCYFKVSFIRMRVFWRQKELKDVAYLPSLCPAPEKAWTLGLGGGTYSSCLWSSIFTWTSPLRDKANNSCGISLKSDARPFRTVLNAEPQEPKTLYHPGHLRSQWI